MLKWMSMLRNQRRKYALISTALFVLWAWLGSGGAAGANGRNELHNLLPSPAYSLEPISGRTAAVVIDDFGNNMAGTEEMLGLPIPLTVAVMPFLPSTKQDAERAHQRGHEVIVHMPMEPISGKASWLGPGAILTSLSDKEIVRRVNAAIDEVPHAVGMNNHMGSKATADRRVMRLVLKVCKERGLYFLDSKTNYRSVVSEVGKEIGIPIVQNHLFLDDVYKESHIVKQCRLLEEHLAQHDSCVTIGHVGRPGLKTAVVLRQYVPRISKKATFVHISYLVKKQQLQELESKTNQKK
ncbi:divergent polysaccharide deacetylase family protein [Paenibacillus sp. MER TA 81-3]|uniref:divergent polysaccharide deacetylase family protein n=1 Tax=Paenibacillus sp. MER TA 81-3 TaxID=2939573 RepID=UPI0020406149|nr:divergent polysaccharide deacetylase family protein [Paenibacillus sp. MER TA 81-3]MCM3340300.1 divergent polysaccharide deacetylase family protein [Paenibacillus sp. MER TA 81-3]